MTPEDLEMALLVGMSPHERRRLEKKKGYSFKFQAQNIITKSSSNTISENSGHGSENNHALSEQFPENGTESKGQQEFDETQSLSQLEDLALSQGSLSLPVSTEDTTFDHDIVTHDTDAGQLENGVHSPANGHLDKDPSICNNSNQAISKNAEKISLLGHGHHGKQVVELLLSNGGEEAINQFCQKWRQIFVEAVHPRYLPSGWNINHRLVGYLAFTHTLLFCDFFFVWKTLFPMHTYRLHNVLNFLVLRIGQDISYSLPSFFFKC